MGKQYKKQYEYIGAGGFNPIHGLLEKGKTLNLFDFEAAQFGASVKLLEENEKPNVKKVVLRDKVDIKDQ